MRARIHSIFVSTSNASYCSGRRTCTGPYRRVFLLRLVVFAILLMKWLLSAAGKDVDSWSNAISPQLRETLQFSAKLSTHFTPYLTSVTQDVRQSRR